MAPKKKTAAKKEADDSESDSGSDSSSSSSSSAEAAPKKSSSKKKAAPKAKENSSDKAVTEDKDSEDKPAEEKSLVFQPPARLEFKPHTSYGEITKAAEEMVYCPTCGLPPDFCQYGPSWEKCKPWCMENFPQYYPALAGTSLDDAKKKAEELQEKGKVKELPGGKKKRDASPSVTIKKLTRSGKKCVTSISGLEGFEVNLEKAAKILKKKFACGCSVVKGDNGQPDSVDVQGDCEEELVDLLVAEYKIPEEKITMLEGGTKKKGKR